jgi:hypothetical protein
MEGYFMSKNIYDIRIKTDKINIVIEGIFYKGNVYYEYENLIQALFPSKVREYKYKFNIELNGCFTNFENKKYVTLIGLKHILLYTEDEELKFNIARQVFGLKDFEIELKIKIGLSALQSVQNKCDNLGEKIHEYDLLGVDLVHDFENNKESEHDFIEWGKEYKKFRADRRKTKNSYRLLNLVNSFLKNHKINVPALRGLYQNYLEVENEIKNPIYHKRIGEDAQEEWKKKLLEVKL